jgi:accessory colonization factor AcfC
MATASTDMSNKVLRVYGPGGPHHVLQECADLFHKRSGVEVAVIKALPHDLKRKLHEDGDIYYGGAE